MGFNNRNLSHKTLKDGEVLDFIKCVWNLEIFNLKLKKIMCSFFKCFVILCFFLKYLPHFWQCKALNVFFTWIITYIKLGVSHLWKKFQDEIVHQRTFTNKAHNFFWLFVKDMKIPYTFYKIQNFQGTPWASIIATCLIKLLRTGPLYDSVFALMRQVSIQGENSRRCRKTYSLDTWRQGASMPIVWL